MSKTWMPKKLGNIRGVEIEECPPDYSRASLRYKFNYKGYSQIINISEEAFLLSNYSVQDLLTQYVYSFERAVEQKLFEEQEKRFGNSIFTEGTSTEFAKAAQINYGKYQATLTQKEKSVIEKLAADVEAWLKPAREVMYEGI